MTEVQKNTAVFVGNFEVTSGSIQATDPCYDPETWCAGEFVALNGKWLAAMIMSDEGDWGHRVASLVIRHENHPDKKGLEVPVDFECGVDSGQFGFFDTQKFMEEQGGDYADKSSFYGHVCELTAEYVGAIVRGYGVVSTSGYGDGSYECLIDLIDGVAVGARVIFIYPEIEEESETSDRNEAVS